MYFRFMDDVMFAHNGQEYTRKGIYAGGGIADLTPGRILKLTHQGATPDGGKSNIYECLVLNR